MAATLVLYPCLLLLTMKVQYVYAVNDVHMSMSRKFFPFLFAGLVCVFALLIIFISTFTFVMVLVCTRRIKQTGILKYTC